MGQGSQSGTEGQHPAWSQMAQMGGSQLPDPMEQAREQYQAARKQFYPGIHKDFWSAPTGERDALQQDYTAERDIVHGLRDWNKELQRLPESQATGTAAMGPPRMNGGPLLAPMMEVPQMPGMQHDGTVQGLLGVLQKQTADRQRAMSPPAPAAQQGAAQSSPWRPAHELGIPYSRDPHPGTRAGGGNPVAPGSLFYRPKYEGED